MIPRSFFAAVVAGRARLGRPARHDRSGRGSLKTGGRLVKHARRYWLLLAESHLTRRLFGAMVRKIAALPVATGVYFNPTVLENPKWKSQFPVPTSTLFVHHL